MRDLYQELAEYVKRDIELVKARCQIAHVENAYRWEEEQDPVSFYKYNELYIFNLTYYQMRLQKNNIHTWYQYMIKKHGWKSGLDYGGGIGEQTILACEQGVKDMTFIEVNSSDTYKYATYRFRKHKVSKYIKLEDEDFKFERDYDFIVAMDVLEHLENPDEVVKDLAVHTEWLFCNPEQVKYNWLSPQHISKFDLTPYFEHQDLYLWRRKNA